MLCYMPGCVLRKHYKLSPIFKVCCPFILDIIPALHQGEHDTQVWKMWELACCCLLSCSRLEGKKAVGKSLWQGERLSSRSSYWQCTGESSIYSSLALVRDSMCNIQEETPPRFFPSEKNAVKGMRLIFLRWCCKSCGLISFEPIFQTNNKVRTAKNNI